MNFLGIKQVLGLIFILASIFFIHLFSFHRVLDYAHNFREVQGSIYKFQRLSVRFSIAWDYGLILRKQRGSYAILAR
jgi:hypothetical protein